MEFFTLSPWHAHTRSPSPHSGEPAVNRVFHGFIVPVAHAYGLLVALGLEDDAVILGERFVDKRRQVVKAAKGWHGADLAIGEELLNLLLGGDLYVVVVELPAE